MSQQEELKERCLSELAMTAKRGGPRLEPLKRLAEGWREQARLARPLESAKITAEKRERTQRWMLLSACAIELETIIETISRAAAETITETKRFDSESEATAFWNSRDAFYRGRRILTNEIEYEKDGTYTVTTVVETGRA